MKRLITILRENNIECLPNERFTLNVEMFPDNVEEYQFPKQVLFEFPVLPGSKKLIPETSMSMFRYFLDGSQRSYRVIDASFQNRYYLPICAGQIGVAVLERENSGKLKPYRDLTYIQNILAVPKIFDEDNRKDIELKINREMSDRDYFKVVCYSLPEKDEDPADKGRAMIIHEMQKLELRTIREMIKNNLIRDESMLVKDGGLSYRDTKIKDLNFSKDDLVQLRNVIGLAKTFKPEMTLGQGRGRQHVGNLTKNLNWKERTTVISPNKDENTTHGWWYLRLRPREKVYTPLQGIIKIEVFATASEKNNEGIDEARADTISAYVLNERNVTPYNADSRWASHIYPIYLAETYLRSSFLSHQRFKSLIF